VPTIFNGSAKPTAKPGNGKLMAPLASYAFQPGGVRFETQEPEEVVEVFLRQHPIVNVPWVVLAAILVAVPTSIIPLVLRNINLMVNIPPGYITVGLVFWYLATFGFILTNFIHWFFNIYIVTNERIVDIDFYYLLYKHFSEAELSKIQDISYTASGILSTVFNYGNITIQTASEIPTLEFEKVPYPEKVVETIRSLTEKIKGGT
jgi:uncharacterized membrane protein YdbT with pleckstrin-like domain